MAANDSGYVADQAGTQTSLGGVTAAQAQYTEPTRRTGVQAVDTSGIEGIANDIASFVKNQGAAAAKAKTEAVEGAAAQTDQQIRFGAANGASAERLAAIATGYQADTGTNLNPQQQATLDQYNNAVGAIKNAQQQNPRFASEQALLIARNRALQANPELSKELLQISGTLNTVSKPYDEAAFAAQDAQQKRQAAAVDTMGTALQAHGYDTSTMSDTQVRLAAQQVLLPNVQLMQQSKDQYDLLKTQKDTTDLQKNQAKDQLLNQQQGALAQTVTAGVRQAMQKAKDGGGSPQQVAQAGQDAITQFTGTLRSQYDITSQADFESRLGWITQPLAQDVQNFASGKLDSEGLQNQLNIRLAGTEQRLLNRVPGAAMTAVLNSKFGTLLGPFIATDPGGKASAVLGNLIAQAGADAGGQNAGPIDITGGQGVNYPQQQVTADAGKVGAIINTMYNQQQLATPEGKSASAKIALQYLTDPTALRTFEPMTKIAPAIADDRWLDISKGVKVPQEALDNANQYLDAISIRSSGLIKSEGANIQYSLDAKGYLHIDTINPSRNLQKLKLIESDLNTGVRMYAHLNGSTDYVGVLRQVIAGSQK